MTGSGTVWHAYLAVTLDGKIARPNGSVDFLDGFGADEAGFDTFFSGVDALVMGRKTYDALIATGEWPYGRKPVTVLTSRPIADAPEWVTPRNQGAQNAVEVIDRQGYGRVWVVGGGIVLSALMATGRIDLIELWVLPVLIGAGIPLFPDWANPGPVTLLSAGAGPQGMVRLTYRPTASA